MNNETELRRRKLIPPESAMSGTQVNNMKHRVFGWNVAYDAQHVPYLFRQYKFKNFSDALCFTELVGELAKDAGHYPHMTLEWGIVLVEWSSPKVGGLHRNDFIMAARTNDIYDRWDEIVGEKDKLQKALEATFPASDPLPVGSRIE